MSVQQVFSGSDYASDYRKGRPNYPASLMEAILNFHGGDHELAVDVGCGPGESTLMVQPFFKQVIGIDNSQAMVDNANEHNNHGNVEYKVGRAEDLSTYFRPESVSLITVGRSIQYFDTDQFFEECRVILKKNATLAFFSSDHTKFVVSGNPKLSTKLNQRFTRLREVDTKGFWEGQIGIKQRRYVDIKVPFRDTRIIREDGPSPIFQEIEEHSLQDHLDLFKSVPAFREFARVNGTDRWKKVLDAYVEDFLDILGLKPGCDYSKVTTRARLDYFIIMSKKS